MSHRARIAALSVAALWLLTGCAPAAPAGGGAPSSPPAATAAPPDGLTASLVQYRRDQPRRYIEVKFANASSAALDVTMLDVTLPGFEPSGDVRRTTHLEPDRRVDLPVPLGEPVCDGGRSGEAAVQVAVRGAGAAPGRATVPIDDDGLLARLHTFDCAVERADEAVAITLSPDWRRRGAGDDLVVRGGATLALRDPAATVELSELAGGILFIAPPEAVAPPPPLTLDGDRAQATVAFDLIPARCDGHAIAEARRLTTVTFVLSVDGGEPVPVRVAPGEAGFETLVTALRDRCGTG